MLGNVTKNFMFFLAPFLILPPKIKFTIGNSLNLYAAKTYLCLWESSHALGYLFWRQSLFLSM